MQRFWNDRIVWTLLEMEGPLSPNQKLCAALVPRLPTPLFKLSRISNSSTQPRQPIAEVFSHALGVISITAVTMAASAPKDEPGGDGDFMMNEPNGVSSPKELQMALYTRCASMEAGLVFNQDELLAFNIIPDNSLGQLLVYTKQLAKDGLFKVMQKDGRICWKVVNKSDAAKYEVLRRQESNRLANVLRLRQVQNAESG